MISFVVDSVKIRNLIKKFKLSGKVDLTETWWGEDYDLFHGDAVMMPRIEILWFPHLSSRSSIDIFFDLKLNGDVVDWKFHVSQ